ncbi:MAG: hypothetical protein IMZ58_00770 [Thermoplasmata archaeon]|nr:hypothetical protein [Thermoplasmata archaeon]
MKESERLSIKSKIWSYKWWLLIGTIFFLIYIGAFIYVFIFKIWERQYADDLRLIIILFLGGIIGEIISKSRKFFYSFIAWICIGLYQGVLFLLIYFIGFEYIMKQTLDESIIGYLYIYAVITFGLIITVFIPTNLIGGLIVFLGRHFIKEKKSDND